MRELSPGLRRQGLKMDFLRSAQFNSVSQTDSLPSFPSLDWMLCESNSPESCLEKEEKNSEEEKEEEGGKKVRLRESSSDFRIPVGCGWHRLTVPGNHPAWGTDWLSGSALQTSRKGGFHLLCGTFSAL